MTLTDVTSGPNANGMKKNMTIGTIGITVEKESTLIREKPSAKNFNPMDVLLKIVYTQHATVLEGKSHKVAKAKLRTCVRNIRISGTGVQIMRMPF